LATYLKDIKFIIIKTNGTRFEDIFFSSIAYEDVRRRHTHMMLVSLV
jgi:hypothetical protein